jgi:hypothetical protein
MIKELPGIKVTGSINDNGIEIMFLSFLPSAVKEQIKKIKFWGKKVGNNFVWTKVTKNLDEQIYAISYLENIELNIEELKDNTISYFFQRINKLPMNDLITLDSTIIKDGSFGDVEIRPIIENALSSYIDTETGEILN